MNINIEHAIKDGFSALCRFIPKPAQPPVIGIDIGTSAIKAAIINSESNGSYTLTAWGIEKIIDGNVGGALEKLLSNVKSDVSPIPVAALSGKGTLIRYIDMPRMPIEDLRKAFVYDMDKYFPFDPETIYTDCFILDHNAKEKRMPVLVAAVKKELVDERVAMFKSLGVELVDITINSIATTNAFARLGPKLTGSTQAKAVLDIGGTVSNLLIIKDQVPRFTRDIFVGSREMTQQIANILGVDNAQAEELKRDPGARTAEMSEACSASVNHLVSEIRLSLDYFMTEKNIQIDEFFLLGGGSLLKGIEAVFENNLGISVKTWDPLAGLRLSPALASSDIRTYSSQLGVAVGLGLTSV